MLNQVINSRRGLHNRITHNILLSPFKLHEVEEYFKAQVFYYERPEIIECYMAMGGVAYYLSLFEDNKSVAQNIQQLCFTRGGELTEEFDRLFSSLFKKVTKTTKTLIPTFVTPHGLYNICMQERSTDRLQETTYFEKCVFRSRKEKAKKEKGVS